MKCKEPIKVMCPFDPAIDEGRCSLETAVEFGRTRDLEAIKPYLKPGVKPMVFHLRPIPYSLADWIDAAQTDAQQNERAFAAACFQIDGLWNPDKTRVDWEAQGADSEGTTLTQAEIERVPRACRQDIGQVARYRCLFLVPWSDPKYVLPDGSAWLLAQKFRLESHVDESPQSSTQPGTETSSRPSGGSETGTGSGDARSGVPTGAAATAPATG